MALLRTARLFMEYIPPAADGRQSPTPLILGLFVCPAGHRAILRSAQFFLEGTTGAASLNCFSDAVPGGVVIYEHRWNSALEMDHHAQWNGHVVLNAGDRLEYSGSNGMTMIGSGAIMPIE